MRAIGKTAARAAPAALACAFATGAAAAQTPEVRIAGRAQAQYRAASGQASSNYGATAATNGFEIRRLRLQADVRFGDDATMVIQPSVEMGSLRMRDAFVRVTLARGLGLSIGQEKSPFQRYELTSSNNLPSLERGLRILGLRGKEAMNDLLVANGYASHDLGAFLDYTAAGGRVAVKAGVQNGSRESAADVNNAKSLFGRVTAILARNTGREPALQIGASVAARDRAMCATCVGAITYHPDSSRTTVALGADLEWGGFRPGLHVIADVATGANVPAALRVASGRNTGNLQNGADSNIVTFRAAHVVAAYRVVTGGGEHRLVKLAEPALRVDLTDPNTGAPGDAGVLLTPAVNLYFASTVVGRAAFDVYRYRDATGAVRTAREFKVSWQASF